MHDGRSYVCSSHTNGGEHLCENKLRVKRVVAETVLLSNIKIRLLSDEMTAYVEKQFRKALAEMVTHDDTPTIESELARIDRKIARVLDAIESTGISDALAMRLAKLEADKADTEEHLTAAQIDREPLGGCLAQPHTSAGGALATPSGRIRTFGGSTGACRAN